VAWIVKLVSIGAEGEEHSTDVMRIARPDDLTDLASLGLTLAEGKQLLASVQRRDRPEPGGPNQWSRAITIVLAIVEWSPQFGENAVASDDCPDGPPLLPRVFASPGPVRADRHCGW
jgi:hypothetical protein